MSWQIAFVLSIIVAVARIIATRRYAQKSKLPASIPPFISYLFGVLPVGLFAGLILFPHEIEWHAEMLIFMAILSVSMTLSNWMWFISAKKIAVAPSQTIAMLTNVVVVILGWSFLGEGLTMYQFVGGGILLAAACLAIWSPMRSEGGGFKRLKPSVLLTAVAAAILLAIGLVAEKKLLEYMDIGGIFLISWPVQTLGMLLLASKDLSKTTLHMLKGSELRNSTLIGLSNGVNGALYIYTIYHSDNISLITVLGTISFPLMILAAYLFLNEREHHRIMWLSLGVALLGLIVMSL